LTAERQQAARRIQEMTSEFQMRHRNRHQHDIESFTIKASMAGLIVMKPTYRNGEQGQVQVGDLVSPGQLFMRIVDLSEMAVEATINQAESELVRTGQDATVRFDAYPDLVLKGKVTSVGTIAVSGRRVNYYIRRIPIRIALESTDPRVIPDSSASADVVVGERGDSIIVPRQAILEEEGKPTVYVKHDGAFLPREVEVAKYSNTEAAIIGGLEAGEEVALERPF
jgi:multidrug resistance efflux pump